MAEKRSRSNSPAGDRAAKVAKVEDAVVIKQMEYYLSDENLTTDRFFHSKIQESAEGYLPMSSIMQCRKIQNLKLTKEAIVEACKAATAIEFAADGNSVRRMGNKALPELVASSKGKGKGKGGKDGANKKSENLPGHEGGVVVKVLNVPEAVPFLEIKSAVRKHFVKLQKDTEAENKLQAAEFGRCRCMHVSTKNEDNSVVAVLTVFDGDFLYVKSWNSINIMKDSEVEGEEPTIAHTLEVKVLEGAELEAAAEALPQNVKNDRVKAVFNRRKMIMNKKKNPNVVIKIGASQFQNVGDLQRKVKEIQNLRSDG